MTKFSIAILALLAAAPAYAQANLSGVWNNLGILHEDWPDRLPGPELGDYAGLPVNDAVRAARRRLGRVAHHAARISVPRAPVRLRAELRRHAHLGRARLGVAAAHRDPHAPFRLGHRADDLDGRPSASAGYALHTAMGFSTGKWDGDILTVTTTHLKEGWTRRNGLARSDSATVTEHFIRHGDHLTLVTIVSDPAYYTEPVVRSRDYEYEINGDIGPYPCEPVEEIIRPKGEIPHHLPGHQPVPRRIRQGARHSAGSRARRRRDDVSGVPEEAGRDA